MCSVLLGTLIRNIIFPQTGHSFHPQKSTVIIYSNGDRFEGQLRNKKRENLGWYFYQNGDVYFGHWAADQKAGFGVIQYKSRDKYIGTFLANKKNGFGQYFYALSGDVYQGFWENNQKHGLGQIISRSGTHYRGVFKNNKKDGKGYLITADGKLFFQLWNMDQFVTQKIIENSSLPISDFNFNQHLQTQQTPAVQEILNTFKQRVSVHLQKHQPDSPEVYPQDSFGVFANTPLENVSSNTKIGSLSHRPSRNFDSLSLIDYADKLKSMFSEKELKNAKEWNTEQVLRFISKIGMSEYLESFSRALITGEVLLKMRESDFKSLGIRAKGDVLKIIDFTDKLKALSNQDEYRQKLLNKKLIPASLVSEKLISRYDLENGKIIEEKSWESSESESSKHRHRNRKFEHLKSSDINSNNRFFKHESIDESSKRNNLKIETVYPQLPNNRPSKKRENTGETLSQNCMYDAFEKNIKKTQSFTIDHEDSQEDFDPSCKIQDDKNSNSIYHAKSDNFRNLLHKPLKFASLSSDSDESSPFEKDSKDFKTHKDKKESNEGNEKDMLEKELKLSKKRSSKLPPPQKQNFSTLTKKYLISRNSLTLIEKLQEGAFGMVYKGKYLHQVVAVKVYKKQNNSRFHIKSFLKEVEILSHLRHPDILLYMGVCVDGDDCYMISEYLENGSLFDHLHGKKRRNPLERSTIFDILKGILRALTYVHGKGFVHCDLKSSNILIDDSWSIKLADFGLSKKIIGVNLLDHRQSRVGTPNWMAPEICRGENYTDKADVYSFGLIVWEIVTNSVPFRDKSPDEVIALVGQAKSQPVRLIVENTD